MVKLIVVLLVGILETFATLRKSIVSWSVPAYLFKSYLLTDVITLYSPITTAVANRFCYLYICFWSRVK